ncbi:hypothetical protein EQ91_002693 [Salmonella enterica subsp. enterica]|nr:hypothetical protein [Salmonella enterica subsp. enterica]
MINHKKPMIKIVGKHGGKEAWECDGWLGKTPLEAFQAYQRFKSIIGSQVHEGKVYYPNAVIHPRGYAF